MSINNVMLMGNLTRDPQVRYTPGGTAVADIGLAVNRTWYDKKTEQKREDVTFVDVTLWGRQAEVTRHYLTKGKQIYVAGRLQTQSWEARQSGEKKYRTEIVCNNFQMLGQRGD